MDFVFIEARPFTLRLPDFLSPEEYRDVQNLLLNAPKAGSVIAGTGGTRKLRVGIGSRGKGKRGGCRIIYTVLQVAGFIHFFAIYGKDEKDDLTASERAELKELAKGIRARTALGLLRTRRN